MSAQQATGRRVLVTGGAAGIGLAMAQAFAAAGDRVTVVDRDPEAIAALADSHPHLEGHALDVTDADAVDRLFADSLDPAGGVDVLCANAGTSGPTGGIEELDLDAWRACLSVNLDGAFLVLRRAVPAMKRRGAGVILLTSSTAGLYGYPRRTPYAAAKWGVIGLAKSLAIELGPHGIRVNALCPGSVGGPRMDGVLEREAAASGRALDAVRARYEAAASMPGFVDASEIADTAVFLASDAARRISGQALAIDGHTENMNP
jgi:NAD(P)-dependent dehydrogenase (short-subunit alcohol dehydrogenase family)